ncbi:hypothetical protein HNY73_019807 [Argiope bruennichi]|uniref:Uncharacterized protein n=1 Tax=Argiope bruennichi TaxID=94029 RepID=A0A8T0E945_ARGBR|nr:hypothetical protein HNY73_019807 [Argiope bruennichi]
MKDNINIFTDEDTKNFIYSVMHLSSNDCLMPGHNRRETSRSLQDSGSRGHNNLWFFGQEVFSKSSLSGISQIAESRTWTRRILWILLFVSCILGFFYHATTYFSLYAAYPTTVDVRVENKGLLEFPELLLDLDVQTEEYIDDHKTPSVLIYVHDPRFYPDFDSEAVKARAGHFYSVGMRKTTTKLLPLPYQTNCTKYSAMPWANRNKGTLTPKMCTQECSRSLQLKACKCVSSNLTLVFEDSPCEGKKAFCAEDVEKNTMDYCRTLCRVPCE